VLRPVNFPETRRFSVSKRTNTFLHPLQVQIFEEVPELAARAILHLLEVHPRSVVENLIRAKGLESLCPVMVLDDPMNQNEKGKTEGAIKVRARAPRKAVFFWCSLLLRPRTLSAKLLDPLAAVLDHRACLSFAST